MFLILNRANLIVSVTDAVRYVAVGRGGGLAVGVEPEEAEAIYSAADDAFYLIEATPWNGGGHRVEEVDSVPAQVVPGFYYYAAGEFYTTPERETALADEEARRAAPAAASIAFVTLAEAGQIDDATVTENAGQFAEWAYPVEYKPGQIRRDPLDGNLYKVNDGQGHTSQESWNPSKTPALWRKIGDPSEEWPEWSQPIGAHDAYELGDKVSHKGKKWVCTAVDGGGKNTWEPGVYGWTEYTEEPSGANN